MISMFSDDFLMQHFALKGGNALNLVHGLGSRTSLDVDLSMGGDFDNSEDAKQRIFRALKDRFDSQGYVLFDEKFMRRPAPAQPVDNDWWGGYDVEFKVIEKEKFEALFKNLEKVRRDATVVGPSQQRTFRVQISKHEFCKGREEAEVDNYVVYVYTPSMIAIEKVRAICQQMPEYSLRAHPTPRGRDFYDIHTVVREGGVNLASTDNLELARNIFAVKCVPLILIPRIPDQREFHRQDWPAVRDAVSGGLEEFDFYFDFVVGQISRLKVLWGE